MGNQPREISEKTLRLRAAARVDDGFFSTFVLRKISRSFTSALVETRIKPNTVTLISMVFGLLAAYIAAQGKYLVAAIAFLFSLVLDCVDGEIARYKNQFSPLGAWLDALGDRIKEFTYIGGLIYSINTSNVWWLGVAMVILQTMRHLSDYNFVKFQNLYEDQRAIPNRSGVIYWVKKVIHFPIGERWLLLTMLPLLISIPDTLRIILYFGIFSFLYVIISRARRMKRWPVKTIDSGFLIAQRDTLLPLRIPAAPISWTIPSFLRGCEFLALMALPLDLSPIVHFVLIASVALWHYTNLYDSLQGKNPIFGGAGLRVAGRIALCLGAYLLGLDTEVALLLSLYLFGLILVRGGHNVTKGAA